ncbi:MAG: triphosphoribosyl-dephospho-CoA synthase, partial [Lacticaseibacillus paracasei]|nr:triphosphoribosyl-dephospho-CoA synthase [Lacticaseibacillus paracasei]
ALGWLLQQNSLHDLAAAEFAPLFPAVAQIAQGVSGDFRDLSEKKQLSHGEALYMKHGVTGVRGEALAGYPTIRTVILPYLRQTTTRGDLRYLQLMVHLMAQVEDANVLHRGGPAGLRFVQDAAKALLHVPASRLPNGLRALNAEMIARNLSPGGTADYLSLAYFFDALMQQTG